MSRHLCYAWFGEEGGASGLPPQRTEKKNIVGLSHDGRKWQLKRDGKIVAESSPTFVPGERPVQKDKL